MKIQYICVSRIILRGIDMLQKFSVKNFKSFKDITLDFSKIKDYDFNEKCLKDGVVNKAMIYGPNGIGKSNLARAIMNIVHTITDKYKLKWEAFKNATSSSNDIVEFFYEFKFAEDVVVYNYGKKSDDNTDIVWEELSINGNRVLYYDRRNNNSKLFLDINGAETLNTDLNVIKISAVKYLRSNTVLPDSPQLKALQSFFAFSDSMLSFWSLENVNYEGFQNGIDNLFKDIIERNNFANFKEFLKKNGIDANLNYRPTADGYYVFLEYENGNEINFFNNCSSGTKALTLFYYWLQRIKSKKEAPSFVIIDEFDAFYHRDLAEEVVRQLLENDVQVILTTHNTGLMTNELLRPDCYFLMFKDKVESLPFLTNKTLREELNIEKMYKANEFNG